MTTTQTPTNWPNPERPGVPMFPERDGLHTVLFNTPSLGFWMANDQCWGFDGEEAYSSPEDAAEQFSYIGPVFTPAQINEMLAEERERCADVCKTLIVLEEERYGVGLKTSGAEARIRALSEAQKLIRNLGAAP